MTAFDGTSATPTNSDYYQIRRKVHNGITFALYFENSGKSEGDLERFFSIEIVFYAILRVLYVFCLIVLVHIFPFCLGFFIRWYPKIYKATVPAIFASIRGKLSTNTP